MSWQYKSQFVFLVACLYPAILCCACSDRGVDLRTPESTIRTYVNAYNSGNNETARRCGMATGLKGVFTRVDYDVNSKKISVPVDGIEYEILASSPGKESVTRMFTTRDTSFSIRFTSKYDREFDKTVEVKLQCRRTVYDEEDTWQIL